MAVVEDVTKHFGDVPALDSFELVVPHSKITVVLGPNGAGKTTAIRLLTGALSPDRGSIEVFGTTPDGPGGEGVRRRCGVVSAKPSLYDRLTGRDNLRYAAELYGLGRGDDAMARIVGSAERFGIDDALDQQVGGYSTGMKTRLALARAVLHDPELLLLDEPTSGLDPESALAVLAMVRNMTAEGRTVLMCTHLLSEAEGLADQVVVIQDGTTLVSGDPGVLAREFWPNPEVTITVDRPEALDRMAGHPGVLSMTRSGDEARLELDAEHRIPVLVAGLAVDGARVRSVVPFRPTLEDLYLAIRLKHGLDVPSFSSAEAEPGPEPGPVPDVEPAHGASGGLDRRRPEPTPEPQPESEPRAVDVTEAALSHD